MSATDPGTLRQYAERERAAYCASSPGVSLAEHRRWYPVESYAQDWINAIRTAAAAGVVLSRVTLDALWHREERLFWGVSHDYPAGIPAGYLPPNARRQKPSGLFKLRRRAEKVR